MSRALLHPKPLLVGGAVALAGVAYAIGTQAGGGNANAAKPTRAAAVGATGPSGSSGPTGRPGHGPWPGGATGASGPRGPWPGGGPGGHGGPGHGHGGPFGGGTGFDQTLTQAAKDLGVSEAKLRAAVTTVFPEVFKDLRADRTDPVAGLADALGLSEDKVRTALESVRPTPPAGAPTPPAGAPPAPNGTPPSGATGPTGTRGPGRRGGGFRGGPGGPGHFGGPVDQAALAKALGVSEADLKAAEDKLAKAHEAQEAKVRATLITKLADELGVSEAKVEAAADKYLPGGKGKGMGLGFFGGFRGGRP